MTPFFFIYLNNIHDQTSLLEHNIRSNIFTVIYDLPRTFPLVSKPSSAKSLSN